MSFIEAPRFPSVIAREAVGGPAALTDVIELASGFEQRRAVWSLPRQYYSIATAGLTTAQMREVEALYRLAQGRFRGFRFPDPYDFAASATEGWLGTGGVGTGAPAYQSFKRYVAGSSATLRKIVKPRSGTLAFLRGGSPVTLGGGPGQASIDTTTGILTFVADQSRSISSHTVGASHVFTLASAFSPNLSVGGRIYVTGVTGSAANVLNNIAHAVTAVSSNVITVSTNTTGLTASGGNAFYYPQPTETLTWSGQFDVPVRFDTDRMQIETRQTTRGGLHRWDSIELVELRL